MRQLHHLALTLVSCAALLCGGQAALAAGNTTTPPAGVTLPGGATSLSETHGDWVVACRVLSNNGASERVCSVNQQQTNQQGQRALTIELQPGASGATGVVVLPFGVAVTKGIQLTVDKADIGGNRPFSTCLQIGCLVPISLTEDDLGKLKAGTKLDIAAIAAPNREFSISASLSGFTAAIKRARDLLAN